MADEGGKNLGYDREAEYFHRVNKELIEKKRRELDSQRAEKETQDQKTTHWMKCPKCGSDMKEIDLQGIKVDQCTQCQGIYFDRGELELLLESQEAKGFLGGLKRLFG